MTYEEEIKKAETLCEKMGKIPVFKGIEFFYLGWGKVGDLEKCLFRIFRHGNARHVEAWETGKDIIITEENSNEFYIMVGGAET